MPRINKLGEVLCANGGPVSVDGTIIAPVGLSAQWWDENTAAYRVQRNGVWSIEAQDIRTGVPVSLSDTGCNELATRHGILAAWLDGKGLFGTHGEFALGGLNPVGTDGRGAISDDGVVALSPNRQSGASVELVPPDGVFGAPGNTRISPAPYGLCILSATEAIWNGGSIGINPLKLSPGAQNIRLVRDSWSVCWVVYWTDEIGLVAHRSDDLTRGYILTRGNAFHHHAVITNDERLLVCWSTGVKELPEEWVSIDVWSQDVVDLTHQLVIPSVDRAVWFGWFEFSSPFLDAPRNCSITTNDLIVRDVHGTAFAQYVAVETQNNTAAAYEKAIADARLKNPTLPVIAYVPWQVQRAGYVPPADWVGAEWYKLNTESWSDLNTRIRTYASRCKKVIGIGQCYTSNINQTQDLETLVPLYSQILHDLTNVVGELMFSNTGRPTGLNDHPEVKPYYEQLFSSIPRPPKIELITPPSHSSPSPSASPSHQPEPEIPMLDRDTFVDMCGKVASALQSNIPGVSPPRAFIPNVSWEELRQGCIQMGDKYRKPKSEGGLTERNATSAELCMGSYMRDGVTHLDDPKVQALFELLVPIDKEYLQR